MLTRVRNSFVGKISISNSSRRFPRSSLESAIKKQKWRTGDCAPRRMYFISRIYNNSFVSYDPLNFRHTRYYGRTLAPYVYHGVVGQSQWPRGRTIFVAERLCDIVGQQWGQGFVQASDCVRIEIRFHGTASAEFRHARTHVAGIRCRRDREHGSMRPIWICQCFLYTFISGYYNKFKFKSLLMLLDTAIFVLTFLFTLLKFTNLTVLLSIYLASNGYRII